MKKALICTALAGFIRSFLCNDIKILQSMGYEVHCAANIKHNGSDGMEEFFKENNVLFHQIDFSSNKPISKKTLDSYRQIRRLVNTNKYDFIHVHTPIPGVLVREACKNQRKKGLIVAYTTHGFYFHKNSSRKSWLCYHTVESLMSRYTDAMITINHEDYENAKKMHCPRVYYIPGVGVDTGKFINTEIERTKYRKAIGVSENATMILAVGELSRRKNHGVVIEAISKIKDSSNIVFVICGNAMTAENTKDELEVSAKEKGVNLILLGLRKDIPEICKCADIGVMPSSREGLGLSGIEMLASGLPVIGSKVHGIVDYINDGVNGYLCDPNSSEEFAHSIENLMGKQKRDSMKDACIKSSLPFDISQSHQKMGKIYKELLV